MGLYDRDYIRDVQPQRGAYGRGGFSGLRMLSVNTWIILICVAVFMVDNYVLPDRDVPTGFVVFIPPRDIPLDMLTMGPPVYKNIQLEAKLPNGDPVLAKDGSPIYRTAICRQMVEKSTGRDIGAWAEVHQMHFLESLLHFSTKLGFLGFEWWRFVGFQFLHANSSHLLFNMLGLFFFGPMVEQYLGSKRYLAFYLLCGICGAIMYLLLNLGGHIVTIVAGHPVLIPGLLFDDPSTPLVGASAGIFGVLMAGAFIAPSALVYLFYVIPVQLRTFAYALLAVALFTVIFGGKNAGGEAGHIGGALAGFYFIRHPYLLHNFFDLLGRVDPTSHHYRHKAVNRRAGGITPTRAAEVDRILAKISELGVHSLTDSEKRTLSDISKQGS